MTAKYLHHLPSKKICTHADIAAVIADETLTRELLGMQKTITLHGENHAELVKALRVHPRFEGWGVRKLLSYVRHQANGNFQLTTKLSKRLIPTFSAVLKVEGIGVCVD